MKRPTREELQKKGHEDYALREQLAETAEDQKRQTIARIDEKSKKILAEIKELQTERAHVVVQPGKRAPFLEFVLEEFRRKRESSLAAPLQAHLKGCHESGMVPFDPDRIRYNFPSSGLDLFWFVITEEDIKQAVAGLVDGITDEEREKKVKEIDTKIAQLSKKLKDLA
jgi:hypothetical protein